MTFGKELIQNAKEALAIFVLDGPNLLLFPPSNTSEIHPGRGLTRSSLSGGTMAVLS